MAATLDIEEVISKATLTEKVSLLAGGSFWATKAIPRLDIPSIHLSDGPNGVRGDKFFNGKPAACLPCGTGLAATWDKALLYEAGILIGKECLAKSVHCWLGPTINIQRSPLGGRAFESFSEDPYISGKLAASIMSGVHSTGVCSAVKHYATNDQETERRAVNCVVSERALREIYLLPFQLGIAGASPASIMTAYNKVNGTHASENKHLLQEILRGEWGQEDIMVMSDWFGTYSVIESLEAGLDLEMPGPPRWRTALAEASLTSRKMKLKTIDDRVRSILKFVKHASLAKISESAGTRDLPEDRALNRKLAGASIVLLKNSKSILPLSVNKVKRIALIGPNMKHTSFSGGGSASLEPYYTTSAFQGITNLLGPDAKVLYEVGCHAHAFLPTLSPHTFLDDKTPGCLIKFFDKSSEVADRTAVDEIQNADTFFQLMDYRHPKLDRLFWATLECTLIAPSSGLFEFGLTVSGTGRLFVNGRLVIDNTKNQREGTSFLGNGSAEERGEFEMVEDQSYKVLLEFASSVTSTIKKPGVVAFPGGGARIGFALKIDEETTIRRAAQLAKECEHVILCAGLSGDWESEGFDRPHMDLPGNTARLMMEVLKANPNTVIITQSGAPITMTPWSSMSTTHLHMWYGGNEGGNGLADVIFGKVNPGGRLPLTFPARCQDNPAFLNAKSEGGRIIYGEDIYVGYRFYDKVEREVAFPFGHGLSYTTFTYDSLVVSESTITLKVTNTGSCSGSDVVQCYIAPPTSTDSHLEPLSVDIGRPVKELRGFEKVFLEPGASAEVQIELDKFAGAFWDETLGSWVVAKGDYKVLVGRSSKDIVLEGVWTVNKTRTWNGL